MGGRGEDRGGCVLGWGREGERESVNVNAEYNSRK